MSDNSNYNANSDAPNPFANAGEKATDQYGLKVAKNLYNDYYKYNRGLFYDKTNSYREQIAYAQGNQGIDRYKKAMNLAKNKDMSFLNLDWRIVNYATKRVNILTNMMYSSEFKATFNAIDPTAIKQKREYNAKMRFLMQNKDFLQSIQGTSDVVPAVPDDLPESDEELEIIMETSYKNKFAMELEKASDFINDVSDYKQIKKQQSFDLVTLGVAGVWAGLGKNGFPENKYVDPTRIVVPPSKHEDFRDIDRVGWVEQMTLSEFRKQAGKQFTEDQYHEIRDEFADKNNRHPYDNRDEYGYFENENNSDAETIPILHFYFKTDIEDVWVQKINEDGSYGRLRKGKKNKGLGKAYKNTRNKHGVSCRTNGSYLVYRDKFEVVYGGSWVIGSDKFVYNYKPMYNMERDKKNLNKAYLPIRLIAPNMRNNKVVSVVSQMIPILDSIQNYTNKLNQLVASAIPKGAYINLDALENANMAGHGGKEMTPVQLLELYFEKGIVVGRDQEYTGGASNPRPVHELENGMARDVITFVNLIKEKKFELDEVIGMNEIMSGGTPNPKTGKTVAQMSLNQSSHAIGHLFEGLRYLFEQTARSNVRSYIEAVRMGTAQQMAEAIGERSAEFISMDTDITIHDFGLKVETLPTPQEWNELYAMIQASIGKPDGVDIDDFLYIKNIDNLKQAEQTYRLRLKKKREARAQSEQQNMQMNAQMQQQSAQMASQMKIQEAQMIEESKRQTLIAEYEMKKQIIELEHLLATEGKSRLQQEKGVIDDYVKAEGIRINGEEQRKTAMVNEVKSGESPKKEEKNKPSTEKK
jgi:hypothetical protein